MSELYVLYILIVSENNVILTPSDCGVRYNATVANRDPNGLDHRG